MFLSKLPFLYYYKNAGIAGYAEAFIPVQSDSQTSEWYSYFENAVLDHPRSLLTHERSRSATIYGNFQLRNYGKFPAGLSSSAALLIFLTASARTRIVRIDFSCRCRLHRHCCRHKAVRHCSVRLACGKRPYCS